MARKVPNELLKKLKQNIREVSEPYNLKREVSEKEVRKVSKEGKAPWREVSEP